MTRAWNGFGEPTPFSTWIREVLNDSHLFDVENLDFIRFAYRDGWLITIEEKRFGSKSSPAQQDTHNIVKQMLESASGKKFQTMRGVRPIEYKGHYTISFEKTTPEDSSWVRINDTVFKQVREVVTRLLKTGILQGS